MIPCIISWKSDRQTAQWKLRGDRSGRENDLVKVQGKQRGFEEVRLQERGKKGSQVFLRFNKYSKQTDQTAHPFAFSVKLEKSGRVPRFSLFPRTVCEL